MRKQKYRANTPAYRHIRMRGVQTLFLVLGGVHPWEIRDPQVVAEQCKNRRFPTGKIGAPENPRSVYAGERGLGSGDCS